MSVEHDAFLLALRDVMARHNANLCCIRTNNSAADSYAWFLYLDREPRACLVESVLLQHTDMELSLDRRPPLNTCLQELRRVMREYGSVLLLYRNDRDYHVGVRTHGSTMVMTTIGQEINDYIINQELRRDEC